MLIRILDLVLAPVVTVVIGDFLRRRWLHRRRRLKRESEDYERVKQLERENEEMDEMLERMRRGESRWKK
jgi:hypothetical protein